MSNSECTLADLTPGNVAHTHAVPTHDIKPIFENYEGHTRLTWQAESGNLCTLCYQNTVLVSSTVDRHGLLLQQQLHTHTLLTVCGTNPVYMLQVVWMQPQCRVRANVLTFLANAIKVLLKKDLQIS